MAIARRFDAIQITTHHDVTRPGLVSRHTITVTRYVYIRWPRLWYRVLRNVPGTLSPTATSVYVHRGNVRQSSIVCRRSSTCVFPVFSGWLVTCTPSILPPLKCLSTSCNGFYLLPFYSIARQSRPFDSETVEPNPEVFAHHRVPKTATAGHLLQYLVTHSDLHFISKPIEFPPPVHVVNDDSHGQISSSSSCSGSRRNRLLSSSSLLSAHKWDQLLLFSPFTNPSYHHHHFPILPPHSLVSPYK